MTANVRFQIGNAWEQVLAQLVEDETIEGVVFGRRQPRLCEGELVPEETIGKLLTAEEAQPLMQGWTLRPPLFADFSRPEIAEDLRMELPQPFYLWTDLRVLAVTVDMGRFGLTWQPRNPVAWDPGFSGQLPN